MESQEIWPWEIGGSHDLSSSSYRITFTEIIDMPRTATDEDGVVQQEEEEEDEDAALGD